MGTSLSPGGYTEIATNTIEYTGTNGIILGGNDVIAEYNTLTQNHQEFDFEQPGGQIYVGQNTSTNFTLLGNVINGAHVQCTSGPCTVKPVTTTSSTLSCIVQPAGALLTHGIESWSPGGTYNDNIVYYHQGVGLFGGNIDGSGITAVAGTLSSTSAAQGMLVKNDRTGPSIYLNASDGVLLYNAGSTFPNFGGNFNLYDLRSTSNSQYGFEWITFGRAPKTGPQLNWGTGGTSAACLTANTNGFVGLLPTGYSGPSSTSTCP